jgi:hypothetical protein
MIRIAAIALLAGATLGSMNSASAQKPVLQGSIPFTFSVNGFVLPPGQYNVVSISQGFLMIESTNRDFSATFLSHDNKGRHPLRSNELIFERYGDQYFLHEIVCPTASIEAAIVPSRQEKEARLELAKRNGAQPVLVALQIEGSSAPQGKPRAN